MDFNSIFGGSFALTILISLCVAIPFLAVAVWLIISARRSNTQAQASQTWPSVMGRVAASSVQVSHSTDSEGHSSTAYSPNVTYEYEVLGHVYRGDRLSFGMAVGSGNHAQAQTVADRYITGNALRIYYNPNNPGEAVLERTAGASGTLKWVAVFIIVILCITIVPILAVMGGVFAILSEVFRFLPR